MSAKGWVGPNFISCKLAFTRLNLLRALLIASVLFFSVIVICARLNCLIITLDTLIHFKAWIATLHRASTSKIVWHDFNSCPRNAACNVLTIGDLVSKETVCCVGGKEKH